MPLRNTPARWGAVAIAFHWLTAAAIAGLLTLGLIMVEVDDFRQRVALTQIHKSVGLTVLALVVLRLAWRLVNRTPDLPAHMRAYERGVAGATHWLLYGLMLAMPLSGWIMASASNLPTEYFGAFDVPRLVAVDRSMEQTAKDVHGWLARGLLALVGLHVLAALKHHFVDRDGVLKRIITGRPAA
jgi:cytochrome b561